MPVILNLLETAFLVLIPFGRRICISFKSCVRNESVKTLIQSEFKREAAWAASRRMRPAQTAAGTLSNPFRTGGPVRENWSVVP